MARKRKNPVLDKNVSYTKLVEMRKQEAFNRLGEAGARGQRIDNVPSTLREMKNIIREDYLMRGQTPPKVTAKMAKQWANTAIKHPNIISTRVEFDNGRLQRQVHISLTGLKTVETGTRLAGTATSRQIERNRIKNQKTRQLNAYNVSYRQLKADGTINSLVEGKAKRLVGLIESEKTSIGQKVWAHEQLNKLYEDEFVAVLEHGYGEGSL